MAPDFGDAFGGICEEFAMTRSVRDAARLLDVVADPEIGDPMFTPSPASGFARATAERAPRLRVGFWAPETGVHSAVTAVVRGAGELLDELGHEVSEDHPAALDEGEYKRWGFLHYAAAAAWAVDRWWPRELGIDRPLQQIEPATQFLVDAGRELDSGAYLEARELLQMWSRRVLAWWDDGFDVLLCPVLGDPPGPTGTMTPRGDADAITFTAPYNFTGQPAASVPFGEFDGLPIGIQIVAAPWREDVVLAVAAEIERARPWNERRPSVWTG